MNTFAKGFLIVIIILIICFVLINIGGFSCSGQQYWVPPNAPTFNSSWFKGFASDNKYPQIIAKIGIK